MSMRLLLHGQLRLILGISLVYLVAWFAHYSQIPAGQYPSEQAHATLEVALNLAADQQSEASDTTGHSLYTYALSVLAKFFITIESLTFAARALNALALILATIFCASAAGHYWQRNRAVWIAGLLIGLNPVLIFWAGEVSPSLLATACMSMALYKVLPWLRRPKGRDSLWIAICLVMAAAFETCLMPLVVLWPALAGLYPDRKPISHLFLASIPVTLTCGLILVSKLQLENPYALNFSQIYSGLYSTLGNQESYDGKSFGFYRKLHFLLLLNPIHWGALFMLAGAGFYVRVKDGHRGHSVLLAVCILTIFAISSALNEGGSQARATLIPLLAIFASGVALLPKIWGHAGTRTRRKITIGAVLLSLFAYAGYFGQNQSKHWARDYTYLAKANLQFGNNDLAATWAKKALELNPAQIEMQEIRIITQFNKWASGNRQQTLPIEAAQEYLKTAQEIEGTSTTHSIEAIYQYKLREAEKAKATWTAKRDESALALLCLYWTGAITDITASDLKNYAGRPYHDLLKAAIKIDRSALDYGETEKLLDNILALAY